MAAGVGRTRRELRGALIAVAVVAVIVVLPLMSNSQDLWTEVNREQDILAISTNWLEGTDYVIDRVLIDGETVTLYMSGSDPLPDSAKAVDRMTDVMGGSMTLDARITNVRVEEIVRSS